MAVALFFSPKSGSLYLLEMPHSTLVVFPVWLWISYYNFLSLYIFSNFNRTLEDSNLNPVCILIWNSTQIHTLYSSNNEATCSSLPYSQSPGRPSPISINTASPLPQYTNLKKNFLTETDEQ